MSNYDDYPDERPTSTGTATSRARTVRAATRKPTKARIALSGASGSGKTWTALSLAEIFAPGGRIVVIDTEPSDDLNTASELYADTFTFDIIDWRTPPYDPRDLALTIRELGELGKTDVLIVDSASAFWRGTGGSLDIAGGNFGGWRTATPAQNQLVEAFLNAPFHVIFCTRAKQEYLVEQGGKKITKLGLAPIQRDDLEYEFQVVAMMDEAHDIAIGKTRCDDLAGKTFHANTQGDLGRIYKRWLDRGPDMIRQGDIDLIVDALNAVRGPERVAKKQEFVAQFGKPDQLPPDRIPSVWAWLSEALDVDPHVYQEPDGEPAEGMTPKCEACELPARAPWHVADPLTPDEDPPVRTPEGVEEPDPSLEPELTLDAAGGDTGVQVDGERKTAVLEWVAGLKPAQVREVLLHAGLGIEGTAKVQRERLVYFQLAIDAGQADPRKCETCGGYKHFPPPGADLCECPI